MQVIFDATKLGYWGPFNPDDLTTPGKMIGGSEANVIFLAKAFVDKGHSVVVFRPSDELEGTNYDGVIYESAIKYQNYVEAFDDIDIIISTNNGFHDGFVNPNIQARVKIDYLNCCAIHTCPEHVANTNYFSILSDFQKHHIKLCGIPEEKMIRTNNGYDPRFFNVDNPVAFNDRDNKIVYISSPDRGLHHALAIFEKIHDKLPEIEFHIFYDVATWIANNKYNMFEDGRRAALIMKGLRQPGVVLRGPTSFKDLAVEVSKAKLLLYPCDPTVPTEAHPKSMLEAMVQGTPCILSNADVLPELFDGLCIEGLDYDVWADKAAELLTNASVWKGKSIYGRSDDFTRRDWGWVVDGMLAELKDKGVTLDA